MKQQSVYCAVMLRRPRPNQARAGRGGGFASNHPVHFASQPSEKLQCWVSHAAPPEVRREVQHTGVTRSRTI